MIKKTKRRNNVSIPKRSFFGSAATNNRDESRLFVDVVTGGVNAFTEASVAKATNTQDLLKIMVNKQQVTEK